MKQDVFVNIAKKCPIKLCVEQIEIDLEQTELFERSTFHCRNHTFETITEFDNWRHSKL